MSGSLIRMRRLLVIFLMLLVTLANLVYASDWHEYHDLQDEQALSFEGHSVSHDEAGADPEEAQKPCAQAHACHAHSHLFSPVLIFRVDTLALSRYLSSGFVRLPAQEGVAPPVPPPNT